MSGTDVDICALLKKLSLRPMREKPRVRRVKKTKPGDGTYVHAQMQVQIQTYYQDIVSASYFFIVRC